MLSSATSRLAYIWAPLLIILVVWSLMVSAAYDDRDSNRKVCYMMGGTWDDNGLSPLRFWRKGECHH